MDEEIRQELNQIHAALLEIAKTMVMTTNGIQKYIDEEIRKVKLERNRHATRQNPN